MVNIIKNKSCELYQCAECKLKYESRKIAEKCQAWCSAHKSCNIAIIKHALSEEHKKQLV